MKKSYLIAILILVISFLWIGSGVLFSEQAPAQEKQLENSHNDAVSELMKVRVMHSQAQEYQKKIHVNGRSQASKDVVLKAEAEGQIIDILVGEGETVTKGTEII